MTMYCRNRRTTFTLSFEPQPWGRAPKAPLTPLSTA